jgi:cell division protein FtsL
MIVAREKTSSYGFFDETLQPRRTGGRIEAIKFEKIALILFILAIFGVGVFVTNFFSNKSALGYKIDGLNKEMALLRVENQGLEDQVQSMVGLTSIEYMAINKLDMTKPEANDYMLITVADQEPVVLDGQIANPLSKIFGEKEQNPILQAFFRLIIPYSE